MTATIQQFNYAVNILQTLLWQYQNAPNIKALLEDKQDWYNTKQSQFWVDFYNDIFNLKTANDFGLAVWAIILGAPIVYNLPGAGTKAWGFEEFRFNFNNGNFSNNSGVVFALSSESARAVLRLRYYQLTGECTVPALNRMLADVFEGYGTAYVLDGLNMTQAYIFNFQLSQDLQFAFTNFDVLPRPAGVGSSYKVVIPPIWGFNSDAVNFDHGNFSSN